MIKKPINQNEERYITKSDRYQISATSSIPPLELVFGEMPENLLPVLTVDGIIVNVGEYKLISQATFSREWLLHNIDRLLAQSGRAPISGSPQDSEAITKIVELMESALSGGR